MVIIGIRTVDNGAQSHFRYHVEREKETHRLTWKTLQLGPKAPVHVRVPRPAEVVVDGLEGALERTGGTGWETCDFESCRTSAQT